MAACAPSRAAVTFAGRSISGDFSDASEWPGDSAASGGAAAPVFESQP